MGGLTANVEYFYKQCNEILQTNYTVNDWGGADNIKKAVNIEWLAGATEKVYNKIHQPKTGCRLLLSSRFNPAVIKITVNIEVVNSIIEYLKKLNKPCDNDCACYRDLNCNCVCTGACNGVCSGPGACTTSTQCTCNCNCTCPNCACQCNCNCECECGSNTECVCDCNPYDCNCSQVLNCGRGAARPSTQNCVYNCGNCECACACKIDSSLSAGDYISSTSSSGGNSDNGCFIAGTSINMADGTIKAIELIKVNDWLFGFNNEGEIVKVKVETLFKAEKSSYLSLTIGTRVVNVTATHPFYVGDDKFIEAGNLIINQQVYAIQLNGSMNKETITDIKMHNDTVEVYNLSVTAPNTFFANGVAVHNKIYIGGSNSVSTTAQTMGVGSTPGPLSPSSSIQSSIDKYGTANQNNPQGGSSSGGNSSGSGCLPLWETLDTPKGNIKLSDLNIGDEIYTWNLFNNKIEIDKVIHKFVSEHKNTIYKIEFEDGGYLYCDGAHTHYTTSWLRVIDPTNIEPFMINIFRVKKLKIGNRILSKDGYKVIKSITKYSEEQFGEIFSEKNLGYVIRGLYSAMPNKDLVKSIPEDFKMYGIHEKKTKSIFKSSIVPMIVYLFRILFKKY